MSKDKQKSVVKTSQPALNEEEQNKLMNLPSVRYILGFTDKYERSEMQELLSCMTCNWLLSLDDFKLPTEHPCGLITQMMPTSENSILVLVPFDEETPNLDMREIHQIIRELTIGIFALNQYPNLVLDANFDESTSCTMPPAYMDTRVGQLMINTDYWLKALWHGSYFNREKRIKFSERWRLMFDIDSNGVAQTKKNLLQEFQLCGLNDMHKDSEYLGVYDLDYMCDANTKNMTEKEVKEEMQFFMNYVDDLALQLTIHPTCIKQYKNVFSIESDYHISSCIKATNERVDNAKFERLKSRLNKQEAHLRENFSRKKEIRENLNTLRLVAFLVPFLIGLKRRMKIPDLNYLLPFMSGDDVHTERELPPLMISDETKCKNFDFSARKDDEHEKNKYFHLHGGIQFELETCNVEHMDNDFETHYNRILSETNLIINGYLESEAQLHKYPAPVVEIDGKRFWSIKITLDNYYPTYPQKPFWISKLNEELIKLKPKRLPMSDINIYDLFKKYFGFKKATKLKSPQAGLKSSAQRGILGIFQSFSRKTPPSRLSKQDESGLSLMHYAAIFNRPLVITSLVMSTCDVNIKQQVDYLAIGSMPIHNAARCGSLDSLSCLLTNFASTTFSDHVGWSPIHYAAYYDNVPAIRLLHRRQAESLEITTRQGPKWTPILVASSAGSLESIKCLIHLGANVNYHDDKGYNLIHVAAHRYHTNVLEYFIKNSIMQQTATSLVINMVKSKKDVDQEAAVKCLQNMTQENSVYCEQIIAANGIEQLISILKLNLVKPESMDKFQQSLICTTLSVLCNLSENFHVKQRISAIPEIANILVKLIDPDLSDDIKSRGAILIADVASLEQSNNQHLFASNGFFDRLILMLESDIEDLLVNTINAFEILCKNNLSNQQVCAQMGLLETFRELLTLNSDLVKASTAAAISTLVSKNKPNQDLACQTEIIHSLIDLLKTRNVTVQLKIAMALESLALDNQVNQDVILSLNAAQYMINLLKEFVDFIDQVDESDSLHETLIRLNKKIQLEKVESSLYHCKTEIKTNNVDWSIVVREQAACALWALAGSQKPKRKLIAEKIGILQIIIMLLSTSEKLQFVGCKCIIALTLENLHYQTLIAKEDGIELVLKLLNPNKTSHRVVLVAIQTIATLCIDVALVNNSQIQSELVSKGALNMLLNFLKNPPSKDIQIETAYAIACVLLGNSAIEENLTQKLDISLILDLFNEADNDELRLSAGQALSILAYNNSERQYQIKLLGGVSYENFVDLIESKNEMYVSKACFQVVILARVFRDHDQVWITAVGISKLCDLLVNSRDDDVIIQTSSNLASLSHTRTGITDAMITCGVVDTLCKLVYSKNEQIRFACAVTLGYLTLNRTASRLLLHNCRNDTNLFNQLMSNLREDSRISQEFVSSYQTALALGLPKLLVSNKVRFVETQKEFNKRMSPERMQQQHITSNTTRSQSAPLKKVAKKSTSSSISKKERPQTQFTFKKTKTFIS